jgi:cation transport regulator ChaB
MPRAKAEKPDEVEIPSTILRSDKHAQRLWKAAHDSAVKTYGEGNASPRRVAFAALKHEYEKSSSGDRWVRKAEKGSSDPQAARGPTTRRKSTDPDRAPTAGGKVAKTPAEAKRKAKEARADYAKSRRKTAGKKSAAKRSAGKKSAGK